MLEGLDKVDWERIGYGESLYPENIPNILQRLTISDSKTFVKALGELDDVMLLYGDRFPARVGLPLIPYLFEILSLEHVICKAQLLGLLSYLLHNSVTWLDQHPYKRDSQFGTHLSNFTLAIHTYIHQLLSMLQNQLPEVRFMATDVLACYGSDTVIDKFIYQMKFDSDDDIRFLTAIYIPRLLQTGEISEDKRSHVIDILGDILISTDYTPYQMYVAYSLAKILDWRSSEHIVQILRSVIEKPSRYTLHEIEWMDDDWIFPSLEDFKIGEEMVVILQLFLKQIGK